MRAASMRTSYPPPARQASTLAGVMRFMSAQTGVVGTNRLPGQRRDSSHSTPGSVQRMNSAAPLFSAYAMISDVLPIKSASASSSARHSGWASTGALGRASFSRSTSDAKSCAWTGQYPPEK